MADTQRILIVDDDDETVHLLRLLLESRGYRCVTGRSGAQGLHQFSRENVGLIITDLKMALGDGITFIQRVRQTSEVPILIVTGFGKDYFVEAHLMEHVTVLTKPVDSAELLRHVRKNLGGIPCPSQPS
jgi:two-component system, OmpR family, KDP operon response regulator KdpE